MKIIITHATVCAGEHVKINDVIDATESDARLLIRIGKADTYSEPVETPCDSDNQEPLIDTRIAEAPSRKVSRPSKTKKKASK